MDKRGLAADALVMGLLAPVAHAGVRNDVPSCYAANAIPPADGRGYDRLIYVLVDQTVSWNAELQQSILDNLNANLTPGTKFVVAEFSAFAQGRYLDVVHTGVIESPMPAAQENNTPIRKIKVFAACLAGQKQFAVAMADASVQSALAGSTGSLAHSDIMAALQGVSEAVAGDAASEKVLVLASDGLENSAVTSFYRRGEMREIDAKTEFARAEDAGLLGDFGGARVFVIGGAAGDGYRTPQMLEALRAFWGMYFAGSKATLVEFGEPALVEAVGF